MSVIADTGVIYAFYDGNDSYHEAARTIISEHSGKIIVPDVILTEVDYLLLSFLGVDAELDFLQDVLNGVYLLHSLNEQILQRCGELIARYRDLELGLADTAVMATAEQLGIYHILTVDERDFRAVSLQAPLTLLPADQG
jgi:predicted nucleic acid-binding protein